MGGGSGGAHRGEMMSQGRLVKLPQTQQIFNTKRQREFWVAGRFTSADSSSLEHCLSSLPLVLLIGADEARRRFRVTAPLSVFLWEHPKCH